MIEVLGADAIVANLARVASEVEVVSVKGVDDAAEELLRAWVSNIESEGLVLTGRYRDSIHVQREGHIVGVATDVEYAGILEHGDSRQAAHPVATRAFDEQHQAALDVVADHVREVIR